MVCVQLEEVSEVAAGCLCLELESVEEHRFTGAVVAGTLVAEVVLVLLVGEGRELVSAASAALDAVPTAPDCIAAASAALDAVPTAPDCIAAASAALDAVPTAPDCIAAASAALDAVPTAPDCIAAASAALDAVPTALDCIAAASAALDAVPTAPDCIAATWSTVQLVNSAERGTLSLLLAMCTLAEGTTTGAALEEGVPDTLAVTGVEEGV